MSSRSGFSPWRGAVCGLLAAAATIGVGQLFAGLSVPSASPVVAVGEVVINHTPLPVKDWATATFGTADKTVLVGGVLVVVFLYSMLVGVLAMRRLALGFAGLVVFASLGLAAALTTHGASGSYALPTVFGALAGAIALRWLVLTARAAAREDAEDEASGWIAAGAAATEPAGAGPAGAGVPAGTAGGSGADASEPARAEPAPAEPAQAEPAPAEPTPGW